MKTFYRSQTDSIIDDNSYTDCKCSEEVCIKFYSHQWSEEIQIVSCDRCHATAESAERLTDAQILRIFADEIDDNVFIFLGASYEIDDFDNVRDYYANPEKIYKIIAPNGEVVAYERTRDDAERKAREMHGEDIMSDTQICRYWITWEE
jgi:hypothetical protein